MKGAKARRRAHIVASHTRVLQEGTRKHAGDIRAVEGHEEEQHDKDREHVAVGFSDDAALLFMRPADVGTDAVLEDMTYGGEIRQTR